VRTLIIVGLGARASEWLTHVSRSRAVDVVAYVEPNTETAHAQAAKFELPKSAIYPSLAEARAAHPEADSIFDIVAPAAREEVVTEALTAGLHVLSEKPLAPTLEQAQRLLQLAGDSGKTWMITQDYRFASLPRTSRRVIDNGAIGEIGVINLAFWKTGRFSANSYYTHIDHPLLSDMMIHHLDMVRYVTGLDFGWLQATGFQPQWSWFKGDAGVALTGEMSNGAHFTHTGVWCSHGKNTTWNGDWHLEGSRGGLNWQQDQLSVYLPADSSSWDTVEAPVPVADSEDIPEMILTEFDSAIRQGRKPETSADDNIFSIGAVYAALESIRRDGERVDIASFLRSER
jgi:predicted dehydrogenase